MKTGRGTTPIALAAMGHMGWKELLPAGSRKRVLCLDVGNGQATLALARICEQVVSLPMLARDVTVITDLVDRADARHVTVVSSLQQVVEGEFDGLVAVLFGGECSRVESRAVRALIRAATERVGSGFVLLGAANVLAYDRRPGRDPRGFRIWGAWDLERLAVSPVRGCARSWPVMLNADSPFEVLHGPYRSPAGRASGAERVKEALLGRRCARWFAPGYVTLGQGKASALAIDELLEHVGAACGDELRLKRHLAMPDKTLLVTEARTEERSRVVVLPHTPLALSRRSHEAAVLRRSGALPLHLRRLVPGFLGRGKYQGQEWFAIEGMPGVFADVPAADLDQVTERAADVLIDLHMATRHDVHIDTTMYDALVGSLLVSARDRHPGCAEVLAQIDLRLRLALLGRTMPLVWMHGDYKIENIGIDQASRQVVSIIDWELAAPEGLPLIDLKYLLVYNRMIRGREAFDAVYGDVAEGSAWRALEAQLLDRYVKLLGLDTELRQILRVLFIVHTLGARLQYDMTDPQEHRKVIDLLETGRDLLTSLAPVRTGGAA